MLSEIERIFGFSKKKLLKTTQKAIDEAYDTALKIKILEDEYFQNNNFLDVNTYSNKIEFNMARSRVTRDANNSVFVSDYSTNLNVETTYFQSEFKKYLTIIMLKLLEFEPIFSIIDNLDTSEYYVILYKLKIIDDILIRYNTQQTELLDPDSVYFLTNTSLQYKEYQQKLSFTYSTHIKVKLDETSVLQDKISERVDMLINKLSIASENKIKIRTMLVFLILLIVSPLILSKFL